VTGAARLLVVLCAVAAGGCSALSGYTPPASLSRVPGAVLPRPGGPPAGSVSLAGSGAGNSRTVRLAQVLKVAAGSARRVAAGARRLELARARVAVSDASLWPRLRLGARAEGLRGRSIANFGDIGDDLSFGTFGGGAGLSYRLNLGAALKRRIAARRDADATALRLGDAKQRAMFAAAAAYLRLLGARSEVTVATRLIADATEIVGIAKARIAAKLGDRADLERANVQLARARRAKIDAEARWQRASIGLSTLLRWPLGANLLPAETEVRPLALADARSVRTEAEQRPDVRAAIMRERAAGARVDAARWDLFGPVINAGLDQRWLGVDPADLGGQSRAWAMLGWSLSFEGWGRLKQRRARLRARSLQVALAKERARGEVSAAAVSVRTARAAVPIARKQVSSADALYQIELDKFKAGTGNGLALIDAQMARARSRLALANAIISYNLAQFELLTAAGLLRPDLVR